MKLLDWIDRLYVGGWASWPAAWAHFLQATSVRTSNYPTIIFTPNPEQLVLAGRDSRFARVLATADVLLPDGIGLLWADRWLHWRARRRPVINQRMTGTDVVEWWLRQPAARQERTLCIGGRPDLAAALARQVDGTDTWCRGVMGYANISNPTQSEQTALFDLINEWRPTVILVAFGAPNQEYWVESARPVLSRAGVKIVMVCGGAFDYLAGQTSRAPASWRALGLEWFYRLLHEPWRWRRQLALFAFMKMIWQEN